MWNKKIAWDQFIKSFPVYKLRRKKKHKAKSYYYKRIPVKPVI
jgi:hypothetical protein